MYQGINIVNNSTTKKIESSTDKESKSKLRFGMNVYEYDNLNNITILSDVS